MVNVEGKLNEIRRFVKSTISKISMDVNVGICKVDEFEAMLDVCEKAKIACKVKKKASDGFIRYYDEDLRKALFLQNYVVNHIDEAIKNGYIKVYYQPVVRTITETFCGMEALARWIDPQYGFLNPAVFIGALEESGQIHKLDSEVINIVCKEMREEIDSGNQVVPVSFNLSRLDLLKKLSKNIKLIVTIFVSRLRKVSLRRILMSETKLNDSVLLVMKSGWMTLVAAILL